MLITLQPTHRIQIIGGARCRLWEGHSDEGIPVRAYVAMVNIDAGAASETFERELITLNHAPSNDPRS